MGQGSARGEHPGVPSRVRVRRQEVQGDGDARGESREPIVGVTRGFGSEEMQDGGFESAAAYAAKEASKFAPLEGTPAAKAAGINATTQILDARVSEDGMYYYYSFRSEGVYPFRFWGASAVGPGQTGGARKLGRRDVVSVVAQMPEDKAKEEDYELLRGVVESFRVFDY